MRRDGQNRTLSAPSNHTVRRYPQRQQKPHFLDKDHVLDPENVVKYEDGLSSKPHMKGRHFNGSYQGGQPTFILQAKQAHCDGQAKRKVFDVSYWGCFQAHGRIWFLKGLTHGKGGEENQASAPLNKSRLAVRDVIIANLKF